jgi:hypothetical protein
MANRRAFVPECLGASSLEGRAVPSTFTAIGNWFSSQYHHVTDDLGISHSHSKSTSDGIEKLRQQSAKAATPAHNAHVTSAPLITSNDTVKVR